MEGTEEGINDLEDRTLEIIQSRKKNRAFANGLRWVDVVTKDRILLPLEASVREEVSVGLKRTQINNGRKFSRS